MFNFHFSLSRQGHLLSYHNMRSYVLTHNCFTIDKRAGALSRPTRSFSRTAVSSPPYTPCSPQMFSLPTSMTTLSASTTYKNLFILLLSSTSSTAADFNLTLHWEPVNTTHLALSSIIPGE